MTTAQRTDTVVVDFTRGRAPTGHVVFLGGECDDGTYDVEIEIEIDGGLRASRGIRRCNAERVLRKIAAASAGRPFRSVVEIEIKPEFLR